MSTNNGITRHVEQYQQLISHAENAILLVDHHGAICFANSPSSCLLSKPAESLRNRALTTFLSKSSVAKCKQYLQQCEITAETIAAIDVMIRINQHRELPGQLQHIAGSSPPYFLCSVQEFSDQNKTNAKSDAEKIKSAIVDACLDTLVTIDMDDIIVEFSAAGEKTFGWTREEVLGRNMTEILIPPEMRKAHERGLAHYRATGQAPLLGRLVQVEALHRDGHRIPVELGLVPIKLPKQHLVTAFLRDISDRKRTEQELLAQKNRAESASLAKSRFLSHMSHEIRSPLNALLGAIDLLQNELTEPKQEYFCSIAESSGHAMLSIINEVLDFSKIESGHVTLHKTLVPVQKIIDSVLLVACSKCSPNVVLYSFTSPALPQKIEIDAIKVKQVMTIFLDNAIKYTDAGSICLRLDWQRDTQSDTDGLLVLDVIDTGIGINKEHQAHIFAEFEQVDAIRDTSIGGTGLGLAIATKLIELMGGQIQLSSNPGEGSCFSVKIPAKASKTKNVKSLKNISAPILIASQTAQVLDCISGTLKAYGVSANQIKLLSDSSQLAEAARNINHACYFFYDNTIIPPTAQSWSELPIKLIGIGDTSPPVGMPQTSFQVIPSPLCSATIVNGVRHSAPKKFNQLSTHNTQARASLLLVEDIAVNRIIARAMLEKHGFDITEAVDGLDAIEKLKQYKFDLVLMDMRMPKLNGLDATKQIRDGGGVNATVPIIALTANAESMEIERCKSVGINAFISKPFNIEHLIYTINMLLENNTSTVNS